MLEITQVEHGSEAYHDLVSLRRRVLRTPLGLDFTPEQLAAERDDICFGAFLDGRLVGCVLLRPVEGSPRASLRLRQMAVGVAHQGRGLGRGLVAFAETWAAARGFREVVLHAREAALGFYERAGYVATGEIFTEVTIPHREMVKPLAPSVAPESRAEA